MVNYHRYCYSFDLFVSFVSYVYVLSLSPSVLRRGGACADCRLGEGLSLFLFFCFCFCFCGSVVDLVSLIVVSGSIGGVVLGFSPRWMSVFPSAAYLLPLGDRLFSIGRNEFPPPGAGRRGRWVLGFRKVAEAPFARDWPSLDALGDQKPVTFSVDLA